MVIHRAVRKGTETVCLACISGTLSRLLCTGFHDHLEVLLEQEPCPSFPNWPFLPCAQCCWLHLHLTYPLCASSPNQLLFGSTVPWKGCPKSTCTGTAEGSGGGVPDGSDVCVLTAIACLRFLSQVFKLSRQGFKGRKHLLFPLLLPTTYPAGDILLAKIAD